tara:strand:+ start:6085 stop:6378 length:294 start_codon:yes stop_codon:yes gene_type:complete
MSAFEALKFEYEIESIVDVIYLNKEINCFKDVLDSVMNGMSYYLKGSVEEKNKQIKNQIFYYICRKLNGKYELEEDIVTNIKSNIKNNKKSVNILIG